MATNTESWGKHPAAPAWRVLHPSPEAGELFQTSLISALLAGVEEGPMTFKELQSHGDFGLGTFNLLDGEMVALDGRFFQLRSDGSARPVDDQDRTPFSAVTFFRPDKEVVIDQEFSKEDLESLVQGAAASNLIVAVRVTGTFALVRTRTVARQSPGASLASATKGQTEQSFRNVNGTLVGFHCPSYTQGLQVGGFHLHFLRSDGMAGGHALDYAILQASIQLQQLTSWRISVPQTPAFLAAKLAADDLDAQIRRVES